MTSSGDTRAMNTHEYPAHLRGGHRYAAQPASRERTSIVMHPKGLRPHSKQHRSSFANPGSFLHVSCSIDVT